jgi:putative flippase GtrA
MKNNYLPPYSDRYIVKNHLKKLIKFGLAGGPSLLVAFLFNHFMVNTAHINELIAYAITIIIQTIINFFICRIFIFIDLNNKHIFKQFYQYFSGLLCLRIADWGLYAIWINFFGIYFLLAQAINLCIFFLLKYIYSAMVLE